MGAWNKYGTISKDGVINAQIYCLGDDVNMEACEQAAANERRYDQPVVLHYDGEHAYAQLDDAWLARLPSGWTQLIGQVKARDVSGVATISDHDGGYRVRIDIEEN